MLMMDPHPGAPWSSEQMQNAGGMLHRGISLPEEGKGCRRVAMGWLAGIPGRGLCPDGVHSVVLYPGLSVCRYPSSSPTEGIHSVSEAGEPGELLGAGK